MPITFNINNKQFLKITNSVTKSVNRFNLHKVGFKQLVCFVVKSDR